MGTVVGVRIDGFWVKGLGMRIACIVVFWVGADMMGLCLYLRSVHNGGIVQHRKYMDCQWKDSEVYVDDTV
jgi:hypothetical protein